MASSSEVESSFSSAIAYPAGQTGTEFTDPAMGSIPGVLVAWHSTHATLVLGGDVNEAPRSRAATAGRAAVVIAGNPPTG